MVYFNRNSSLILGTTMLLKQFTTAKKIFYLFGNPQDFLEKNSMFTNYTI